MSPKEVLDYEFAVFADLDFNLYVPLCEFMPHFNKIFRSLGKITLNNCNGAWLITFFFLLEIECIEEYLGTEPFYKIVDGGYEIVGTATSSALATSV